MGKNKLKKFADMAAYEHVFEADFEDLQENGTVGHHAMYGKWHEWFGNTNPIVLELGCGRGEYAVGLARRNPQVNYIGIDIKGARMHTGATQAKEEDLKNVAFIRTRIEFVEAFFAPGEVAEIWVTFPDPQMNKPRKRLIGTLMLTRYASFLRTDGLVHLKTDSPFLITYAKEMLKANGIAPDVLTEDLYADGTADPSQGIRTYYEQKWIAAGKTINYVRFRLPAPLDQLTEPDVDIPHDDYHSVGRGVKSYQD